MHLLGDQARAETHVRRMLDAYRAPANRSHLARFQYDQRITDRITLARVLWLRGKAQEALREIDDMVDAAQAAGHNLTLCHALSDAVCPVSLMAGDLTRAERYSDMLHRRTRDTALDIWHAYAECFEGDILIRTGEAATGVSLVPRAPRISPSTDRATDARRHRLTRKEPGRWSGSRSNHQVYDKVELF